MADKELSALAASHLFEVSWHCPVSMRKLTSVPVLSQVLKASNCDAAIFKYQILHKYSGYVQELDFDDKHADVLRYLLSIISPHAFPSITRLATSGKVAKSLLGDSVMSWDEDEEVYLRSTFRTLAGRIEALEMRDFGAVEAARFLSYFSRLRSVQLSGVLDLASGDDNPLPAALALHDLRSLSFDKTASFGISCTTATWPFASSLTQFRLRTANLGAGDLRIISVFPPTIEDLSLTFQRLDKSFPPGIDLVIGFSLPLLRNLPLGTLSQGNSTDGAWAILAGLATSPLHSLHYTTYDRPTFKFNSPLVLSLKAR